MINNCANFGGRLACDVSRISHVTVDTSHALFLVPEHLSTSFRNPVKLGVVFDIRSFYLLQNLTLSIPLSRSSCLSSRKYQNGEQLDRLMSPFLDSSSEMP